MKECGSQGRKWPGCAEFLISLVACFLAGDSSCPLVFISATYGAGGDRPPPFSDSQCATHSFGVTPAVNQQMKNKYTLLHHLNCMVPRYRQRMIGLFRQAQMWLDTRPLWSQRGQFGGSRRMKGVKLVLCYFVRRHDIMPNLRQGRKRI